MRARQSACVCVCACACACACECACACACACACVRVRMCVCVCVYACACACIALVRVSKHVLWLWVTKVISSRLGRNDASVRSCRLSLPRSVALSQAHAQTRANTNARAHRAVTGMLNSVESAVDTFRRNAVQNVRSAHIGCARQRECGGRSGVACKICSSCLVRVLLTSKWCLQDSFYYIQVRESQWRCYA